MLQAVRDSYREIVDFQVRLKPATDAREFEVCRRPPLPESGPALEVVRTEIWTSSDNGKSWRPTGAQFDGGLRLLVSQWKTTDGWPYRAMHFKVPVR
ncbi:hypothetical protein ACWFPY_09440 [Nocardia fluminea]